MMGFPMFLIVTLISVAAQVLGENILFIYPNASPSHKNIAVPIMLGLAERGHNVTVVSSFKTEAHPNIRDVNPITKFDYFPDVGLWELRQQGIVGMLLMDYTPILSYCHQVYQNQEFMDLLNQTFDLVLMDSFANECFLGFVHRLGAPYIYVSPLPVPSHISQLAGNRLPPSFVPHFLTYSSHRMTTLERTVNVVLSTLAYYSFRRPLTLDTEIYRRYLGADIPDADTLLANMSMQFVNSHFSFNFPRPTMPDVVEIGAVHCRSGRPLPKELDEFLDDAEDGAILFSLGSIAKPHEVPERIRKVFVNVFSKLKQRVLWKWPLDMPDLPPNVKLLKWVPQQDVLAHPNVRLFMTHSGLLSTQESIYHGVPMVAIPLFGDQDLNAQRAAEAGIAVPLEILDVTEDSLERAITEVLTNTRYNEKVTALSTYLRDQTEAPKERAVFWAEYVMRHKGAMHLRSAARDLNFFQYYSLDVAAIIAGIVTLISAIIFLLVRKTLRFAGRLVRKVEFSKKKVQ